MSKRFLCLFALVILAVAVPFSEATEKRKPAEAETLRPFVVDATEDSGYHPPTLDQELERWRNEFNVKALEKPEPECTLSFRIFVIPQLIGRPYCVAGKLYQSDTGAGKGIISLRYFEQEKAGEQCWEMTSTQSAQVYLWFRGAKLLNKETPEGSVAGIDGEALFIEGYTDGRGFKFMRNSGNSSAQWFFDQVDAFRIWKGLSTVESPSPTLEKK